MTAKSNRRITGNSKRSGCNGSISYSVLNLKFNSMNSCIKNNVFSCCKILTGNSYVFKLIAVNIYLTCCVVKLKIVRNSRGKSNAASVYNQL